MAKHDDKAKDEAMIGPVRKVAEDAHFRIDELARSQMKPEHLEGAVHGAMGALSAHIDQRFEHQKAEQAAAAEATARDAQAQHDELMAAHAGLMKSHGELMDAHRAVLEHLQNPPDRVATAQTPTGPINMTISTRKGH